jgi:hypothetical protein
MAVQTITYAVGAEKVTGFDRNNKPYGVLDGTSPNGRVVGTDFTSSAPAGTAAEEIVARITIAAKDLSRVGAVLSGYIWAVHAANTNSCVLNIRVGAAGITATQGTVIATVTSAVSADVALAEFLLIVTGLATEVCIGKGFGGALKEVVTSNLSLTVDTTAAIDIIVTCNNATTATDLAYKGSLFFIQ